MSHEALPCKVSYNSQCHKVGPKFSTHKPLNTRPKLLQGCSQKVEPLAVCNASQVEGFSSSPVCIQYRHAQLKRFVPLGFKVKVERLGQSSPRCSVSCSVYPSIISRQSSLVSLEVSLIYCLPMRPSTHQHLPLPITSAFPNCSHLLS